MKQKDIITLVVPTFIIIIAWVVFSIYHNAVTSTIPESLNFQIVPINPNFNEKTISDLKTRQKINPLYDYQVAVTPEPTVPVVTVTVTPTPSTTIETVASESALPLETQTTEGTNL